MQRLMTPALEAGVAALDARIAERAVSRERVTTIWDRLATPLEVAPGAWLALRPRAAQAGPIVGTEAGTLRTVVELIAQPIAKIDAAPDPEHRPLPDLARVASPPSEFHVALPVRVPYAALNKRLAETVVGTSVDVGGGTDALRGGDPSVRERAPGNPAGRPVRRRARVRLPGWDSGDRSGIPDAPLRRAPVQPRVRQRACPGHWSPASPHPRRAAGVAGEAAAGRADRHAAGSARRRAEPRAGAGLSIWPAASTVSTCEASTRSRTDSRPSSSSAVRSASTRARLLAGPRPGGSARARRKRLRNRVDHKPPHLERMGVVPPGDGDRVSSR
jgi:hypothetical protein